MVLVVVVDDEHPHKNQPSADAGENSRRGVKTPGGSGTEQNEQREGAERTQAALPLYFYGKRPGCELEISACSHGYDPQILEDVDRLVNSPYRSR